MEKGTQARGVLPEPFELARRAELVVAEIYDHLARHFAENTDLKALFSMLADEERAHAQRVESCAAEWERRGIAHRPPLDSAAFTKLVARAERFCIHLATATAVDADGALRLAGSLEDDFALAHAEALASAEDPTLCALFSELAKDDHGHAELLARRRRAAEERETGEGAS